MFSKFRLAGETMCGNGYLGIMSLVRIWHEDPKFLLILFLSEEVTLFLVSVCHAIFHKEDRTTGEVGPISLLFEPPSQ